MGQRKIGLAACTTGLVVAVILSVPALKSLVRPSQAGGENRTLAPFPKPPKSSTDLLHYTRQLDPWINDHFGFRASFIKLNNMLRHALFDQFPTIQVISGREGRIFLSSHSTTPGSEYSAITIPCGDKLTSPKATADPLNALHESFRREGINARIMIVPSAPTIYPEALPLWLEARCKAAVSPIEATLASEYLNIETRKAIYFPKAEMLAMRKTISVFPKSWFHWAGDGPREVAGLSVEFFWNIPQQSGKALAERSNQSTSDLQHLFPGIDLVSQVNEPDHTKSQIDACKGPQCFPSLGNAASKLGDVAIYRNPAAPKARLIILSDSFGHNIAVWYPRYFKEVIHFSTNHLNQLDAIETLNFKTYIKAQAQTGDLMLLYHDGSALWGRPAQDQDSLFVKHPNAALTGSTNTTAEH